MAGSLGTLKPTSAGAPFQPHNELPNLDRALVNSPVNHKRDSEPRFPQKKTPLDAVDLVQALGSLAPEPSTKANHTSALLFAGFLAFCTIKHKKGGGENISKG